MHYEAEYNNKNVHKSWLKIKKIEKLNKIISLNDFKNRNGEYCSDKPSRGGYWLVIDNQFETLNYTENDCPIKKLNLPLKENHTEEDLEAFLYKNPKKLGDNSLEVVDRQYKYIDLLLKEDKNYIVVELKKYAKSETLAQIIDYIDIIEEEFCESTRGLIICNDYDPRLKNSIDWLKKNHHVNIELITYGVKNK